jgi:2-polyprenyl-3-methyl-5-hydroxy-6-metoxy-1,4-benzoquinol methylase
MTSNSAQTDASTLGQQLTQAYDLVDRAYARARDFVDHLHRQFPADRDVRLLLAEVLLTLGDADSAATLCASLLADAPPNERIRVLELQERCEASVYVSPSFREHLNGAHFGLETHRQYSGRDVQRARLVVRELRKRMPLRGKRALDVGGSFGGMTIALAEQGADVTGMEIAAHRFLVGQKRLRELDVTAEWRQGDICTPRLSDILGQFDVIVCQDSLEHVLDPRAAIQNIGELLRPGGIVHISVPNKFGIRQILADDHWQLPGITLLSRRQSIEYWMRVTGRPAGEYDIGFLPSEKFYRHGFRTWGVELDFCNKVTGIEGVKEYGREVQRLREIARGDIHPALTPVLRERIRSRMQIVIRFYDAVMGQLEQIQHDRPDLMPALCTHIAQKLCHSVWWIVGRKKDIPQLRQ